MHGAYKARLIEEALCCIGFQCTIPGSWKCPYTRQIRFSKETKERLAVMENYRLGGALAAQVVGARGKSNACGMYH